MSGHSKWSTIKHKKGLIEAKRCKVFTKMIREITVAARMGGGDPASNPKLRSILFKARMANMPKDNIERAVKRGVGEQGGAEFLELQYEAYAPGGVGLLINTLTENKNRTAAEIRSILNKWNGSLAASGAVSYQFERKGVITVDIETTSYDNLFEAALEAGAEDVSEMGEVYTDPFNLEQVVGVLETKGFTQNSAEVIWIPDNQMSLSDEATRKVLLMTEKLEDCDDVQSVASNLAVSDDFDYEGV